MSKRLLIVEDEPIIALELQETLKRRGYDVPEIAGSADTVFEAFRSAKPDLVLMDINLRSYTDGIDAAKRLSLFGSTPIVFITANEDANVEKRARGTSNSYYIKKPFDEERLVELIEQILAPTA